MNAIHLILGTLLLLSFSLSVLAQGPGQDSQKEALKRALEMREQIHRRLMEHLFNGTPGKDDEIFKDMEALFEDVMSGMRGNFQDLAGDSKAYDMAWTESREGRTLLLSPHDKKQRLEINVEKGMVTIKGQKEEKVGNNSSVSSFSHIYSVPNDCDWTRVKMLEKEGKILMTFPYKTSKSAPPQKKEKNERKPVGPSEDDVTI